LLTQLPILFFLSSQWLKTNIFLVQTTFYFRYQTVDVYNYNLFFRWNFLICTNKLQICRFKVIRIQNWVEKKMIRIQDIASRSNVFVVVRPERLRDTPYYGVWKTKKEKSTRWADSSWHVLFGKTSYSSVRKPSVSPFCAKTNSPQIS